MPDQWFEKQSDGQLKPLTLLGEADGEGGYIPLQISFIGDPNLPAFPFAPTMTGSMSSQTSALLSWTLNQGNRPPVTSWVVQRRQSVDNGVSFGAYSAISGSPFSAATLNTTNSSLPTQTSPELVFDYRVAGVNGDGQGDWSSILRLQYQGSPQQVPEPAFSLNVSLVNSSSATLTWDFPANTTVLKQAIYKGNTLIVDDLDKLAKSYVWSGLTPGVAQANVNIRRQNSTGWSIASNYVTFTPQQPPSFTFAPLIGSSNSPYDHGGTDDWDAWRVYSLSDCITIANRTGVNHPKILGVTSPGNIYTVYQTAYDYWIDALDQFYYGGNGSQTIMTLHAVRGDVEMHIANGNEYAKDITTGNLNGFVNGCRGIYDATRVLNPNGSRRYPLASSWVDPTHDQEGNSNEGSGIAVAVKDSLYPAVPYLDGVAWSMYPPGRKNSVSSPTLDWPSFDYDLPRDPTLLQNNPAQVNQRGYLSRCFRRTYEAQDPTYNSHISTFHPLKIATWETGTGDFPLSQSIRPYFAVHGMLASMGVMAKHFDLEMTEMLWWDSMTDNDPSNPQNKLSDEPIPGAGQISTRVALQNWTTYNHYDGDSHPADWPQTGPPNTWPNRNNTWKDEWNTAMNAEWPL